MDTAKVGELRELFYEFLNCCSKDSDFFEAKKAFFYFVFFKLLFTEDAPLDTRVFEVASLLGKGQIDKLDYKITGELRARIDDFVSSNLDLSIIHSTYESLTGAKHSKRKLEGIFYTPQEIVSEMLKRTFEISPYSLDKTILDPSLGSGTFLVSAFKILATEHDTKSILKNLYGVDRDELAANLAKLSLIYEAKPNLKPEVAADIVRTNIRHGDALISPTDAPTDLSLQAFDWGESFKPGSFDYIVGNPPYGLSRDNQISEVENTILKQTYKDYRSGKANKYMLFMAKAHQLLNQMGSCTFIVPNSWLGIKSGEKLRKIFLNNHELAELWIYDCPVFQDPNLEAVVFFLNRSKSYDQICIKHFKDLHSAKPIKEISYPISLSLARKEAEIPTIWSNSVTHLIEKLNTSCVDLGSKDSCFSPKIALQAYAEGKGKPEQKKEDITKRIYDYEYKFDKETYPYINGDEVLRDQINWKGNYLRHGPFLADPQPIERFSSPRILVREIINRAPYMLVACYTEETYLYNKSVLHIHLNQTASKSLLKALTVILNSKLASFQILYRGKKSQRKLFPKIVNQDLKNFLIPKDFEETHTSLLGIDLSNNELDQRVYELYSLTKQEIEMLESSLEF